MMQVRNPKQAFTKQQKIGLAVLLFLSLAIIIFWYVQLKRNIIYPLYGGLNPKTLIDQSQTATSTAASRDTDGDGLSDADEAGIYHTSAYLADSDSDGIADGVEIKNNTNPNCPEGKACAADGSIISASQESASSSLDLSQPVLSQEALSQLTTLNNLTSGQAGASNATPQALDAASISTLKTAFGTNPDPTKLRQALLANAAKDQDKATLNNLTDGQLLQLYHSMIGQ